jgi:ubiquinol-cytochrome c reductase cytochrome b subunit
VSDLSHHPTRRGVIADRLALSALDYPVPARANRLDFMLGAMTLVALVLLALTGIVLTQFYNPAPLSAHTSVRYIITQLPLVTYLRDVHVSSAAVTMVLVFAHIAAVFWRGGFRKPREGLWWSGVLLLALLFGLAFTGTVLRTDQESVEALAHALAGAKMVGPLGQPFLPGFSDSSPLLARYYALHVSVLPLALTLLVALHFWLIRHLGVSAAGTRHEPFSSHLRLLSGYGLLLVAIVAALGLLNETTLLAPGVDGVEITKPFWPFLFIYAAENKAGMIGMLLAPAILFGFLALVPLIDRQPGPGSRVVRWIGIGLLIVLIGASIYAAFAPAQSHLEMGM